MQSSDNFDWDDVEGKIAIICRRFENLRPWHDDLAQELRIHAYCVSTDYYNLYRKAIDFWRRLQTQQAPEIPYYDLEVLGQQSKLDDSYYELDHIVKALKEELYRPGNNKWDEDNLKLSRLVLDIILEDIDPRLKLNHLPTMTKSSLNHYINGRINISWLSEELGVSYKRIISAVKLLEDMLQGLSLMGKIDISPDFLKNYYN